MFQGKSFIKKYSHQSSPHSHLRHTVPGGLRGNTYCTPHFYYELLLCTALSSEFRPTLQPVALRPTAGVSCCLYLSHTEQLYYKAGVGFLHFSIRRDKNQNTSHKHFFNHSKVECAVSKGLGSFFSTEKELI